MEKVKEIFKKIIEFLKDPKKRALVGGIIFAIFAIVFIALPSVQKNARRKNVEEILGDKYGKVTVMWDYEAPWFEITDDGKLYFYFTRFAGENGVVEIPYMFDGVVVTAIAEDCFVGARNIEKVIIPESVTTIGGWAFDGCTALTEVQLSEGLKNIGNWAFANCPNLKSVTLPQSLAAIGRYAFQNCTGIESVTLGKNVMTVRNGAFAGCTSLTEINVSAQNRYFQSKDGVLYGKGNGTLFAYPCGREGDYSVIEGTKELYLDAFRGAKALEQISLPEGLYAIGEYCFEGCLALSEIKLPQGIQTVPTSAFSGCKALSYAYLPESVANVGMGAFHGCESLKNITYGGSAEKWDAAKKAINNAALDTASITFEK